SAVAASSSGSQRGLREGNESAGGPNPVELAFRVRPKSCDFGLPTSPKRCCGDHKSPAVLCKMTEACGPEPAIGCHIGRTTGADRIAWTELSDLAVKDCGEPLLLAQRLPVEAATGFRACFGLPTDQDNKRRSCGKTDEL